MALVVIVLVLGIKKAVELPVEVLPDLTKPTVTILTESAGFAPEEVETLVTMPLENSLMGGDGRVAPAFDQRCGLVLNLRRIRMGYGHLPGASVCAGAFD